MKKFLIILAGMSLSMNLSAAELASDQDGDGTEHTITTSNCGLLTESVNLQMSAYVEGGYDCDTNLNQIAVAACHPQGRKDSSQNNYIYVGNSSGGSVSGSQSNSCTSGNASTAADNSTTS